MKKLIIAIILLILVFCMFVVLDTTFKDKHSLKIIERTNKYF